MADDHIVPLDSIRGVAALSVVVFHIKWLTCVSLRGYVNNSYLMVDLFFVLSGFVICNAYGSRLRNAADAARFMWLRFWRLYPVHLAMLIAFAALDLARAALWSLHGGQGSPVPTDNLFSFASNLLLLQSLHLHQSLNFNGPSWSISVEFYTYVVFACVALSFRRWSRIVVVSALMTVAGAALLLPMSRRFPLLTFDFGILRSLTGFFTGVLTFALYDIWRSARAPARFDGLAIACAAAFVLYLSVKQIGASDLLVYPLSAGLILCVALSPGGRLSRLLGWQPFAWLGRISYSIYMVHVFVIALVAIVFARLWPGGHVAVLSGIRNLLIVPPLVGNIAAAAVVGVVLFLAHLSYEWIEKPAREWSRAWLRAQRSPAHATVHSAAKSAGDD